MNRRNVLKSFLGAGLFGVLPRSKELKIWEQWHRAGFQGEYVQIWCEGKFIEFYAKHARTKRWDVFSRYTWDFYQKKKKKKNWVNNNFKVTSSNVSIS